MSQSSGGYCQKVSISEPRHRAGDSCTVVHDGGLVGIQVLHEVSFEVCAPSVACSGKVLPLFVTAAADDCLRNELPALIKKSGRMWKE
jgi:hypothetical protein